MNGLKVIQPGMLTLIQDTGRFGAHSLGLTHGGPLDRQAFDWANRLLGNKENASCLEISFGGLVLESNVDSVIVITGAELPCMLNGAIISQWQTLDIKNGDKLELGYTTSGTRAYLAVAGGFDIPRSFGSSSTVVREKIGGIHGDKLQADDSLPCKPQTLPAHQLLAQEHQPEYGDSATLRVVRGYQQHVFDQTQHWRFFNSDYQVTERSDRMGFRLEGATIKSEMVAMLSEGICHGAIQIPADGQPIVLMNDRQTIGGYPKIGSVIPIDTAKLAQLSPGATVSFEAISLEQAHNLHWLEKSRFERTQPELYEVAREVDMSDETKELELSQKIEDILVARNLRGMKTVQSHLKPGYCLRAAQILRECKGHVLIGTGFPVVETFETDGPVGTIALYDALETLGATPVIVCGRPLSEALASKYLVHEIRVGDHGQREQEAIDALEKYQPDAIVSIERPGQAADGGYYNMRGESISPRTACFDTFMNLSQCPTIAVGDGGNEIGMGKVSAALKDLNIVPAATSCDELIVADVSNWGAYGIISFLSIWHGSDLLREINPLGILEYISELGSVDGVTRINQLTEDGLPVSEGESILRELREICGFGV